MQKEHPAYRAARMIRDMHQKTIDMIDEGHVFKRDDKDVSQDMREQCLEQIGACEQIMDRAEHMDPESTSAANEALVQLTALVEPTVIHETDEPELPEMGSYEHRNGSA